MPGHAIKLFVARILMAFSFHMIYNIDRRSVCGVISCTNKMGFAATIIRNIVFITRFLSQNNVFGECIMFSGLRDHVKH